MTNSLHHRLVALGERHGRVELDAAARRLSECDVGRLRVDSDTARLQLLFKKRALDFILGGVKDLRRALEGRQSARGRTRRKTRWAKVYHQDAIGRLGDCNDLTPASATHRRAFYNAGQIEQLYFSVFVVDGTGNARQGCKLVCRHLAVDAGQLAH